MYNAIDESYKSTFEEREQKQSLEELAKEMQRNPLAEFSTTQLKVELRRRKKERGRR